VVRPDTILYLSLSIAKIFENDLDELRSYLEPILGMNGIDWLEIAEVRPLIDDLRSAIDEILTARIGAQSSFMMQPIWKTVGKKVIFTDDCLDIFVWSDFAFTRLFMDTAETNRQNINRRMRSVFWLSKMLYDYSMTGKIDYDKIIDTYTYDTKNDKAFSVSGRITNKYMICEEILSPRINKSEIKNIILGGGQNFLSPERRLDATILATPGLFE